MEQRKAQAPEPGFGFTARRVSGTGGSLRNGRQGVGPARRVVAVYDGGEWDSPDDSTTMPSVVGSWPTYTKSLGHTNTLKIPSPQVRKKKKKKKKKKKIIS
ncbi:hypothetical protein CSAL01_10211 [Colletotrichum salicis]|uniref:Uncharacterized protein n=1 Tax=Colletotrichum salicis TaxID=1209931 RepID=A0A135T9X9_9PEZI|nr:hypothetical protein CSAL01_10211 [Colletotrichum salicis]